jgi:hypothetical protein
LSASLAPDPGRRHVGTPGDIISECLGDFVGIRNNWKGDTPAELSVLVHEMVHHLQKKNHLNYECHGAREELAYKVQEKWLSLFGRDLASEFQIDPFTLKVSTTCGF